jgi:hypothetical protein
VTTKVTLETLIDILNFLIQKTPRNTGNTIHYSIHRFEENLLDLSCHMAKFHDHVRANLDILYSKYEDIL